MAPAPAPGDAILHAVEQSPLAVAMRNELWLYPAVEVLHICGIVILVGAAVMFDLRLLGFSRGLSVRGLAWHVLPWSVGALLVIVPTGLLMFSAHAGEFVGNRAFLLKLLLLMLAATNAAAFHAGVFRTAGTWDSNVAVPVGARLHAAASLALWIAVITCGRLIAYV
jgi:hypothetical protein